MNVKVVMEETGGWNRKMRSDVLLLGALLRCGLPFMELRSPSLVRISFIFPTEHLGKKRVGNLDKKRLTLIQMFNDLLILFIVNFWTFEDTYHCFITHSKLTGGIGGGAHMGD